jgi:SH3-like domain-containing protein
MKSRTAVLLLIVVLLAPAGAGSAGKMMSVQVKRGDVRATPAFLGSIVATLGYGDRVEVVESRSGWMRVAPTAKSGAGWMHSSALSEKRIVLQGGSRDAQAGASSGELALAGKGFNADVESEFKARNRNLDFSIIDRMQATEIPQDRIASFLKEGGLAAGGAQ